MTTDQSVLRRWRRSLFECSDNLCNGYNVDSWPLPPISMPFSSPVDSPKKSKFEVNDTPKMFNSPKTDSRNNLQCFTCTDGNRDCYREAETLGIQICQEG